MLQELINQLRDCIPKPLDKTDKHLRILDKCKGELRIVTDLDPKIFRDERIIDSFKRMSREYVDIKMIYDPRVNLSKTPEIGEMINKSITARQLKYYIPQNFIVVDREHTRVEAPHPFQEYEGYTLELTTIGALAQASRYLQKFDNLWERSATK